MTALNAEDRSLVIRTVLAEYGADVKTRSGITLTPRELLLIRHIAEGDSDREIAKARALAVTTIGKDIYTLRQKLGAKNRAHAVVIAIREGLYVP